MLACQHQKPHAAVLPAVLPVDAPAVVLQGSLQVPHGTAVLQVSPAILQPVLPMVPVTVVQGVSAVSQSSKALPPLNHYCSLLFQHRPSCCRKARTATALLARQLLCSLPLLVCCCPSKLPAACDALLHTW
eukprot:GHRQ01026402.1.p1 GENE.GHRQ01026402.1~~GHRQ01026402.1.p1  ORF type:complete len:131 (-),score=14.52 GHRQ01026402.1:145-537(-)